MAKLQELYDARNRVWEVQKELNDKATKEERDFTAEETEAWEKADEDFNKLSQEIESEINAIRTRDDRSKLVEAREEILKKPQVKPQKPDPQDNPGAENRKVLPRNTEEYRSAFYKLLANGSERYLNYNELRALQMDKDTQGGFLVAPQEFVNELIQAVDNEVYMRRVARIFPVMNADSVGVPALDDDMGDVTFTAEIKTGSADTTMSFDKREMRPHPCARRIKVSKKLIRTSVIPVEQLVRERFAYKVGTVLENAYLNGSGVNQPLGLMTAHASGINTDRDVSTGNTTTSIKADGLIEAKYTLKPQYMRTATWIFHRDAIKMIRKLKDGEGNYLWQPGMASDRPDTILGNSYIMSEYMANTFQTTLKVGIIGDFRWYWIVDAMNMQIQVLPELYAETNENGYIVRMETDGAPVLSEAFVRVKLA